MVKALRNKKISSLNLLDIHRIIVERLKKEKLTKDILYRNFKQRDFLFKNRIRKNNTEIFLDEIYSNEKINLKNYKETFLLHNLNYLQKSIQSFLANLKIQDFVSKGYDREKKLNNIIATKIQTKNLRLENILLKEYTRKNFFIARKIAQELVLKNYEKENVFWRKTEEKVWGKFSKTNFHEENRLIKKVIQKTLQSNVDEEIVLLKALSDKRISALNLLDIDRIIVERLKKDNLSKDVLYRNFNQKEFLFKNTILKKLFWKNDIQSFLEKHTRNKKLLWNNNKKTFLSDILKYPKISTKSFLEILKIQDFQSITITPVLLKDDHTKFFVKTSKLNKKLDFEKNNKNIKSILESNVYQKKFLFQIKNYDIVNSFDRSLKDNLFVFRFEKRDIKQEQFLEEKIKKRVQELVTQHLEEAKISLKETRQLVSDKKQIDFSYPEQRVDFQEDQSTMEDMLYRRIYQKLERTLRLELRRIGKQDKF